MDGGRAARWAEMKGQDRAPRQIPPTRGAAHSLLQVLHHLPPPKTTSTLLPDGTSEVRELFVSSVRPTRVYVPGAVAGNLQLQVGLFKAIALPHIAVHSVDLGDNDIGNLPGSLPALANLLASQHCIVSDLALYCNALDDGALVELSRGVRNNDTLVDLNLADNAIGAKGVRALCEALSAGAVPLEVLDLQGNELVGDEGARALATLFDAARDPPCELRALHLGRSGVGGDGVAALCATLAEARAAGVSVLETLDLDSNDVGERGARALAALLRDDHADVDAPLLEISLLNCGFGLGLAGAKDLALATKGGAGTVLVLADGGGVERGQYRYLARVGAVPDALGRTLDAEWTQTGSEEQGPWTSLAPRLGPGGPRT